MIFVTGDTHRLMDIKKIDEESFPEQSLLTRDDYLIIAGDFGGVWTGTETDDDVLNMHGSRNYTTLFVGGNHENYDVLNSYPVEEWNGGKIHKIRESVFHLMNGQVYNIDGTTFFVMGGATSVDKVFREEGVSWWPQEEPSSEELDEAFNNLAKYGNKVDYIITHTIPEKVRKLIYDVYTDYVNYESGVEKFLDLIMEHVSYDKWYSGHVHMDREFSDYRLRILYNGVVKIK